LAPNGQKIWAILGQALWAGKKIANWTIQIGKCSKERAKIAIWTF